MIRGLLSCSLALSISSAAWAQAPAVREDVRALEDQVQKVVRQTEPSLVSIVVSHAKYPAMVGDGAGRPGRLGRYIANNQLPNAIDKLDLADPQNLPDHLFGSGLVLDAEGLILTPYHLVEGATKIYVRSSNAKGSYADFHAYDARSDLAGLKLIDPPAGLKPIRMGDVRIAEGPNGEKPTVAKGSFVLSMGHPQAAGAADGSASVSFGVLSNVRRRAIGPREPEPKFRALHHHGVLLQTDARITLGCSGAALLNFEGELIGITTPMAAVTGAETAGGFAIPMDANYRRIIDALRMGKEVDYGYLGVVFDAEVGNSRLEGGLKISEVTPGTPAAAAGLVGNKDSRYGDSIVAVEGNPIKSHDDLFLYVGGAFAGTKVAMTLNRDGKTRTVDIYLAKYDHSLPWLATVKPPTVHGLRVDYGSVLIARAGLAKSGVPAGVFVRELDPGSPAEAKFKALGETANRWIITHVNGKSITTPLEFYREAKGPDPIVLKLSDPTPNAVAANREIQIP